MILKEVEEEENYETSYDDTSDDSDIIEKNTQKMIIMGF